MARKDAKSHDHGQLSLLPKPVKSPKPTETEVEAYAFIRQQLRDLGWIVKDPSKNGNGQVWTQNQCLADAHMKVAFGLVRPENVVKLSEKFLWVIEAKPTRKELDKALAEATEFYSEKINATKGQYKALMATGVAGNEESGYLMRTVIRLDGKWQTVTINRQEATGLLSPDDVRVLLRDGGADVHEFAPPQWLFISAAERINETLHTGGINKNDRAKTMAALLLAVIDTPPDLDTKLPVLIADINSRSDAELKANGKADFAPFVKIFAPTNTTNHVKFKNALVKTILELQNLNIRSAMNSSTDVLGQFYEVFLKYGNGAKEIGIVLTPRHITRFAVEAINIGLKDLVLDPACGTGGFLVAAFDHVRRNSTRQQIEKFKRYNLFGIEQESYVAVMAIVNMIFRGDGKHNITEGNCFSTHMGMRTINGYASAKFTQASVTAGSEPVTRVVMNPPFVLRGSKEHEYRFVSHALSLMADGGILFSLLPLGALFGSRDEKVWRRDVLLRNHTLLSVVTMPDELFYPAAQKQVAAIIVKKGTPHPKEQDVFWARIERDGHLKVKSKRLPAQELRPPRTELDQVPTILPPLRAFIASPGATSINVPRLCKTAPIDYGDPLLELLPEAYVDSEQPSPADVAKAVDEMVREERGHTMKQIESLFNLHRARSGLFSDYEKGDVPYVGNGLADNAVVGFVSPLEGDKVFKFVGIAVSAFCEATVQTPPFIACGRAGNGLSVLEPKSPMPVVQLAYIGAYINTALRWRFNWYRQTTVDRIKHLSIPDDIPKGLQFDVSAAMPAKSSAQRDGWRLNMRPFALGDIYELEPGHFHSIGHLPSGSIPVVSCGDYDNGVIGYFDTGNAPTFADRITIAFNGDNALTAKYHPYRFAAKDDVAVCHPREPLLPTTELFIQTMVNRERWRYSYYRKCYSDKLRRFRVSLPAKNGSIDEETIRAVVEASPYWGYIQTQVAA